MTNRFIKLWTLCSLFGICCGIKAGISDKNKEMPVYQRPCGHGAA